MTRDQHRLADYLSHITEAIERPELYQQVRKLTDTKPR